MLSIVKYFYLEIRYYSAMAYESICYTNKFMGNASTH